MASEGSTRLVETRGNAVPSTAHLKVRTGQGEIQISASRGIWANNATGFYTDFKSPVKLVNVGKQGLGLKIGRLRDRKLEAKAFAPVQHWAIEGSISSQRLFVSRRQMFLCFLVFSNRFANTSK